jgi:K+-transporting ATPase ATPase C chain
MASHHYSLAHVPVDLVTASASGLDPDISIDAANFQAVRIAEARGLNPFHVEELIKQKATPRSLGFLGENRVNVLDLNRALDQLQSSTHE